MMTVVFNGQMYRIVSIKQTHARNLSGVREDNSREPRDDLMHTELEVTGNLVATSLFHVLRSNVPELNKQRAYFAGRNRIVLVDTIQEIRRGGET